MASVTAQGALEGAPRSFKDLLTEVYDVGRCTYCLVCLDACSQEGCDAVTLVGDSFEYTPVECVGSGMCYVSCPEVDSLDIALEKIYRTDEDEIGHVELVTSVMSGNWALASKGRDGNAIPSILQHLLRSGQIDAAVVPAPAEKVSTGLLLAVEGEETITPTGYKFRKPATTRFLRDLYRSKEKPLRMALVANPCQARMVRRMQLNNVPPARDVKLIIGPFCYATLSNARWRRSFFEKAVGSNGRLIRSVDVGDDVRTVFHDGTETRVGLDDLYLAYDSSCLSCVDFSNSLADISVGPTGSPAGFETVLVRTADGAKAFKEALDGGHLVEWTSLFRAENAEEFRAKVLQEVKEKTAAKVSLSAGRGRTTR